MSQAARALIDTEALRHNLKTIRQLAPNRKVMAVIKANGYGHGMITVAQALSGADSLAVARVDEAMLLRDAGLGQTVPPSALCSSRGHLHASWIKARP